MKRWWRDRERSFRATVEVPGLSVVELVMGIEELFGLTISDAEAERIPRTPGGLKAYLTSVVPFRQAEHCATQRAFYRLRGVVSDVLQVPRTAIRPRTPWEELLPTSGRRESWEAIAERAEHPSAPPSPSPLSLSSALWSWLRGPPSWKPPITFRDTVGATARLLAAMDPAHGRVSGPKWTREEICLTVDRLVVECCEIVDFSDDVFLAD